VAGVDIPEALERLELFAELLEDYGSYDDAARLRRLAAAVDAAGRILEPRAAGLPVEGLDAARRAQPAPALN
jgi:hypothetical protein